MHSAGWIDIWHIATAILARQSPVMQILAATFAALFVVMAIEGLRSSLLAIWRNHRDPVTLARRSRDDTAAAPPPGTKSFLFKPGPRPVVRRKALTENPRQFSSPRPTIRRHPAASMDDLAALPQYRPDVSEDVSGAV
jgi:hypothetical protein